MKGACNTEGHSACVGKLAVIAFMFIVLNLWTGLANWVQATNVWWFVGAFVILAIIFGGGCCGAGAEVKTAMPRKKAVKRKTAKKKK